MAKIPFVKLSPSRSTPTIRHRNRAARRVTLEPLEERCVMAGPGGGGGPVLDLMLVLDGSGSILPADFVRLRSFAGSFTSRLAVGAGASHVGVVQFATQGTGRLESGLTGDASQLQSLIGGLTQLQGNTDIEEGLSLAQAEFLAQGRPSAATEVVPIVVLVTDGKHNQPGDPNSVAAALKAAGVEIFTVGIGWDIDQSDLEAIASDPDSAYFYKVDNYQSLELLSSSLADAVWLAADGTPPPPPPPPTPDPDPPTNPPPPSGPGGGDGAALSVVLDASTDSGVSASDGITNVNRPVFTGRGTPGSTVTVMVGAVGSATPLAAAQAVVGADGTYRAEATITLADGAYQFVAVTSSQTVAAPTTLVIDTVAPRLVAAGLQRPVRGLRSSAARLASPAFSFTVSDDRTGFDANQLMSARLYGVRRLAGRPTGPGSEVALSSVALQSAAGALNQQVRVGLAQASAFRPGLYRTWVADTLTDLAGNRLDGEFVRTLPSGNSRAGGTFDALFVASSRTMSEALPISRFQTRANRR